jgi:dipeptidyl aminopeptidase/acylaminoacyl peptidase
VELEISRKSQLTPEQITQLAARMKSSTIEESRRQPSNSAEFRPAVIDGKRLTHLNDLILSSLDLREAEPFWFTSVGQVKVQGFLIKPPTSTPTRNTPSNSSSTEAHKAHGETRGAIAGTPNSSPPTATLSS